MRHDSEAGCPACELTNGTRDLPGGRIFATTQWVVEHCIGPLPVGTLIVKPLRHCTALWDLTPAESEELGPLLRIVSSVIRELAAPDQVYACLWSHAGWTPGHLHFVVQPAWNRDSARHQRPGPFAQAEMFSANVLPNRSEVESFAERARAALASIVRQRVKR